MTDEEEPLDDDARKALAQEAFIQDKLANDRKMYFRNPDGSFSELPPKEPTDQ
jgi:hypothetical protein